MYKYVGTGKTIRRCLYGYLGLLSMRQNMIHDYHGGRERNIGIMVCTKVKGHTQNLFSWSPLPCESLAQESTPNPITLASFPGNKKHQL